MITAQVAIPDPTVLPVVTVNWSTGATWVSLPLAVVNIPLGVGVVGPAGPPGPAGSGAVVFTQASASAQWSFANPLARVAAVAVFDTGGNEIEADVVVTTSFVTVTFSAPNSGKVVVC